MHTTRARVRGYKKASIVVWSIALGTVPFSGCGVDSLLRAASSQNAASVATTETVIVGDVATSSPDTGLPQTLSGTLSDQFEGSYDEIILQVFFDEAGSLVAAVSRSLFTVEGPQIGTITTINHIVVVGISLMEDSGGDLVLDQDGNPIPVSLTTAGTGQIIHGTGDFEGAMGELHSESTVFFGGGMMDLGTLDSSVVFSLEQ